MPKRKRKTKSASKGKEKMNLISLESPDVKKMFEGTHEVDWGKNEADLLKNFKNCKKNPGHVSFIPFKDLTISRLPASYQSDLMLALIQAMSDITVMIKVKYVSPHRPDKFPDSLAPYPFSEMRGKRIIRTGTGRLSFVPEDVDTSSRTCPCASCLKSDTPSKEWGVIQICTTTHVVFDDLEAARSTVTFGYEDKDHRGLTLDGWRAVGDVPHDWCELRCLTHDVTFVQEMEEKSRRFYSLCLQVNEMFKSLQDKDKLTIIVSHPHGCPKQVTIGQWNLRSVALLDADSNDQYTRYTYTTCTCPGSSGAPVYTLGDRFIYCHTHSGANDDANYSALMWEPNELYAPPPQT
ncbi:uncharacterized protein LOC131930246 [Physella acuta]|uniref:uncharacterized protein LOC131930246 n=1 Tax=Physella acuta TaxID=109671 RepID=UPI0027DD85D7|nr:uncharacterized protein LOC131930246 [Physella acuta]